MICLPHVPIQKPALSHDGDFLAPPILFHAYPGAIKLCLLEQPIHTGENPG